MSLYEQAIRLARANGFAHNEALAYEVAGRFYLARGYEQIAHLYLRNARHGYLRWGARGKVRQLDELYPHFSKDQPVPGSSSMVGASIEHLELATVIKVSQAVSGEIVLEKLIDTLLRTALDQAGAERGVLLRLRGDALRIEAEATTKNDTVLVQLCDSPATAAVLPESVLHYVLRFRESIILDDATGQSPFAGDPYIRQRQARSVLCLPLLNQAKLVGVLYLENSLAAHVFAPARTAVLKLLASQAAIALENTHLYRDLAERNDTLPISYGRSLASINCQELMGAPVPKEREVQLRNVKTLASGTLTGWSILGGPGHAADNDIVVGFATAQSGFMVAYDQGAQQAAILAIEKINAEGGVNGRKFRWIVADIKSDRVQGAKAGLERFQLNPDRIRMRRRSLHIRSA